MFDFSSAMAVVAVFCWRSLGFVVCFVLLFVKAMCALVDVFDLWCGSVAGLRVWGFLRFCGIFSVCRGWERGASRPL